MENADHACIFTHGTVEELLSLKGMTMTNPIATGFEFELLPDGTVRIRFHDNGGKSLNTQVITGKAFQRIPLAAFVTTTAMDQGAEVAKKLVCIMRAAEEAEDRSDE